MRSQPGRDASQKKSDRDKVVSQNQPSLELLPPLDLKPPHPGKPPLTDWVGSLDCGLGCVLIHT